MEAVGTLAYTLTAGSVDFMLYNTLSVDNRVQWVCWKRGVEAYEMRHRLFEARVLLEWDGVDYTYDFDTGRYRAAEEHPELGWLRTDNCLPHSGGAIARFGSCPTPDFGNGFLETTESSFVTLKELALDSESPLKLEIRFRPTPTAGWHNRVQFMKTKNVGEASVASTMVEKVAHAA